MTPTFLQKDAGMNVFGLKSCCDRSHLRVEAAIVQDPVKDSDWGFTGKTETVPRTAKRVNPHQTISCKRNRTLDETQSRIVRRKVDLTAFAPVVGMWKYPTP